MKASALVDPAVGVTALVGDGEAQITHVGGLAELSAGGLSFFKGSDAAVLRRQLPASAHPVAVICLPAVAAGWNDDDFSGALLVADHPRLAFMRLASRYFPPAAPPAGIHPTASVDPSATIDPTASIGAFCAIGPDCQVGAGSVLHPHVTLYRQIRIGANVIVHSGTAIGADGFGYERTDDGRLEKFPHVGGVIIEDGAEIGSNTSIDRGSLENTILRRGCKVDNQVHVAHNVEIGEDAVVIAQSMIGGSVRIGPRAWLAPASVVMNQVRIGADALVGLGAVVTKDVPDGTVMMGAPAVPEAEFKANRAALKALLRGE